MLFALISFGNPPFKLPLSDQDCKVTQKRRFAMQNNRTNLNVLGT